MHSLDDRQIAELHKLRDLADAAYLELDESYSTGLISDSKSAVFAVMTAADAIDLPTILASEVRQLARESWEGAVGMGEVYERAGKAIAAIGKLQRLIESFLDEEGSQA